MTDLAALPPEVRRELAQRELARRHFMPFVRRMRPDFEFGWFHELLCAKLEQFLQDIVDKKSPRLMINTPPRHGKLCADTTPVLTVRGWKTHGELRPGDFVFGLDGQPTEVLAVSAPDMASLEVVFYDGSSVKVHPNHEWTVYDRMSKTWKTYETKRLVGRTGPDRAHFQLPLRGAVQFHEGELLPVPQRSPEIREVRPCRPEKGRCIQVAASDGLYLVGKELIPTHNSTIASQDFPSWGLGRYPWMEFIATSYAINLPVGFSRNIRARIRDDEGYKVLFKETELHPESQGVEQWRTTANGGYRAAGVGGGITGTGAHCLIVDDPVKDAEEADSETILRSAWDWYNSTAYTRLAPGGGVLLIMTRWSDLDLAGRILAKYQEDLKDFAEGYIAEGEFDRWEVLSFPATAKEDEEHRKKDEALHPERFNEKYLKRIRRTMPARWWNAMYQQDPVPDEGAFFTRDQFRMEPRIEVTNEYRILGAWDLAAGQKQSNDWTVSLTGALDYNGYLHLVDMLRGRWGDMLVIADMLLDSYVKHRHHLIGIEKGQLELALMPTLKRRMQERRLFPPLAEGDEALKPITDKTVRARPAQGLMQQGMVRFPKDEPWVETMQGELLRFPHGTHDDIVDAFAWLTRMAERQGAPPPPKTKVKVRGWRDKLRTHGRATEGTNFMEA